MTLPIGEFLVQMGTLTAAQRDAVLVEQRRTGRPFGDLAERMFGINGRDVERAWAVQYAQTAPRVDPAREESEPAALALLNRRQAWQFRMLPLRFEGGGLLVASTPDHLVRALNFATRNVPATCHFLIAEPETLARGLMRHYPMDGMGHEVIAGSPESVFQPVAYR